MMNVKFLKIGDPIQCISAKRVHCLTKGKSYKLKAVQGHRVVVENDANEEVAYSAGRFMDIYLDVGVRNPDGTDNV